MNEPAISFQLSAISAGKVQSLGIALDALAILIFAVAAVTVAPAEALGPPVVPSYPICGATSSNPASIRSCVTPSTFAAREAEASPLELVPCHLKLPAPRAGFGVLLVVQSAGGRRGAAAGNPPSLSELRRGKSPQEAHA
ncbi:MAG: hypothetical protein C0518_05515 [Opitutus sp.]|nr:hypothetical protein [Opitutus sp.]